MHSKLKSRLDAILAREKLRGRGRVDSAVSNINDDLAARLAASRTPGPPSVAELMDAGRSELHIDAKWFSAATLEAMRSDLKTRAARTLAAGDLTGYDEAIRARDATSFSINLWARSEARSRGEL
jgi:hypothetical protein